jgi:FAD/FMN-containing dehydrogenase
MSINSAAPTDFRGDFLVDVKNRALHGSSSGILERLPDAVAIPKDAGDVAVLARWAAENSISLIPRGAGTGMPGGNVGDGVVVDLVSRFRDVGEPNRELRRVTVQPGVTLAELNAACLGAGLHLPVDPSSGDRCTIGGMIANNSAGAHSVR